MALVLLGSRAMPHNLNHQEFARAQWRARAHIADTERPAFITGLAAVCFAYLVIMALLFFANLPMFEYTFPTMIVLVIVYFGASHYAGTKHKRYSEALQREIDAITREKNDRV